VLLDDLHHAHDSRHFAVGVVEKSVIALLHRPNVIPRGGVADAIPRLWLLSRVQVVNGELDINSFFNARLRLCLHQPI
jgi:hypothetical protein